MVGGIAPVYETELVDPLVVPPFTLTVEIHGGIGIGALMGQYGYALSVSLDMAASVVGVGARILQFLTMTALPGSYSISSAGAKFVYSKYAVQLPGSFIVTGNASRSIKRYRLNCQENDLAVAFGYVEIYKDGAGSYRIKGAAGGFSIAGQVATLSKPVSPDPYFSQVEILLPFDGSTSTTVIDASTNQATVSVSSAVTLSSTGGPFGNGCAIFSGADLGATNYPIRLPDNYDYRVLNDDFTIEFWIYMSAYSSPGAGYQLYYTGDAALGLVIDDYGYFRVGSRSSLSPIPLNTWTFITYGASSDISAIHVNGVVQATYNYNGTLNGYWDRAIIGQHLDGYSRLAGRLSDFRLTVGQYRGAVVPAGPFPTFGGSQPPYSPTATAPGGGATYGGSGDNNLGNLFNGLANTKAV